ncbi:hypothetical protein [Sphingomonas sp. NIBR02145]|uniref:hypothetical protein n=1 Tax=Sphingomonas sp. NIBR02145 TaxID=3014784 RepID=UPI0022B2BD5E|nr:hypothetical protein [Sphingomonas sp. NIBR02145]WHU00819.1 hypothetical protein O3305_11355 [Sphingomonas sp. NIBR02145]
MKNLSRAPLGAACLALLAVPAAIAQPAAPSPHGPVYAVAPPMDATIEQRLMPQLAALLHQLLREKRAMRLDGVPVFDSGDKFLPGKIASGLSYLLLDTPRTDPKLAEYLAGYREIADLTLDDPNDTWGIYYYISALHALKQAGLLDQAVRPETIARLREKLDWRRFVDAKSLDLLHDLPNNYYGVAFSVARLRYLLGWEDEAASTALLQRMIEHYRSYSGQYGFADETDGHGRFDRYSVLLIGEIAQRFIETGMSPTPQVKAWLRKSAELMLHRATLTGEGWEYGRSIGTYGETAFLEVLTAAARLGVLTPKERDMAYALSSRIAARYADFWLSPATGSVNLWDDGRRTDGYRGKHRILGENLSLARQYIYTNALWNGLGYKGAAPSPDYAAWLRTLPAARFTWFARGDHDRALLTLRDKGHVIGLPIINGAEDQHMHNPYFPIPFSGGMLQGSADASFPQLTPRFALADGSVLMPLAWFRGISWKRQGSRTIVGWRQDAMDRMGENAPVADKRITVTTRYEFTPGRITRTDTYRAAGPVELSDVTLEFASFSGEARSAGPGAVAFGAGEVTGFSATGYQGCTVGPAEGKEYRAPTGAFASLVRCRLGARRLSGPLTLRWSLTYR